MDITETSAMFLSKIFTANVSRRNLLPSQIGHFFIIIYFSISARVKSESVSFHRLLRLGITPSNEFSEVRLSLGRPAPGLAAEVGLRHSSPYNINSIIFWDKSLTGTLKEKPWRSAKSDNNHQYQDCLPTRCEAEAHGLIAPSPRVRPVLGKTSSESTSNCDPKPVHSGQAP